MATMEHVMAAGFEESESAEGFYTLHALNPRPCLHQGRQWFAWFVLGKRAKLFPEHVVVTLEPRPGQEKPEYLPLDEVEFPI